MSGITRPERVKSSGFRMDHFDHPISGASIVVSFRCGKCMTTYVQQIAPSEYDNEAYCVSCDTVNFHK